MPCFISFRDIDFTNTLEGVRVRIWTDVFSHVWVRVTAQEPHIHKKMSVIRGLPLMEDLRFCFTVFEDFEQLEAGHTICHTFWLANWPYCTTKWLYIWGSINTEVCVSTSAIFRYHNNGQEIIPVPDPMYELNPLDPELIVFPTGGAWDTYDFSLDVPVGASGVILMLKILTP
ncbi:unnamed protein product, partial [marine sediment metagenome]